MRRLLTLVTLAVAFLTLFSLSGEPASAQGPEEELPPINDRAAFRRPTAEVLQLEGQLRSDVETRMSLGLNADVDYVQSLRGSDQDVGSAEYDIPLTRAEYDEVQARWAFASAASTSVIPYVRELPTFAGVFYDHSSRGDLVILLTEDDPKVRGRINVLTPEGRATRVEIAEYTQSELRDAMRAVWDVWEQAGGPELYVVAVDEPANAIRIEVDVSNLDVAQELVGEVSQVIGIPTFVVVGVQPVDQLCNDRDNCYSPFQAGIRIRKGSSTAQSFCTMGFQITIGSDVQFLTAGHCGHSGSNSWYHKGYGLVGAKQATLYVGGGMDIMRVQINNDTQASDLLYKTSHRVNTAAWPTTGMGVCASLGTMGANTIFRCGTVTDSYMAWNSGVCGCVVYGGRNTILTEEGDSGSPIVDSNLRYTAIGIHNSYGGYFAIVRDALIAWNAWVY